MDGWKAHFQGGIKTGCAGTQCLKCGFLGEEQFRRNLINERKRTERSKHPFVLILLNIEKLFLKDDSDHKEVHSIMKAIHRRVRETDISGWFQHHKVLGVIFTETEGKYYSLLNDKIRDTLNQWWNQLDYQVFTFPSNELKEGKEGYSVFYRKNISDFKKKMTVTGKRVIDLTISLILLLLLLPVFLIIGMLIKFSSPGPIFFRQLRVGSGGRTFSFLKFRSMYVNNDDSIHRQYVNRLIKGELSNSDGVYKITNDPRVTPLGRILRKTSLDELPQLINVIMGEMSLVGPRPPIPYELEAYEPWHFRRIMECKPGITGLWQVEGRSKTTFDGMVRMDIRYSSAQSVLKDFMLILRTPVALLFTKGAY